MAYDYVIVGAGSAGAVLAARLSEDPGTRVLLLEAGPDYPDLESLPEDLKYVYGSPGQVFAAMGGPHNWKSVARATALRPEMPVARGKVTGGSSAINMAAFPRGLRADFDAWAAQGNDRWSFADVLPYFRKLETDLDFRDEFHGADGPIVCRRVPRDAWSPEQLAFYRASRDAGFPDCPDLNRADATGVGPLPVNCSDRVRWSTAIGYLNPARGRPNLTIQPDSLARRIVLEGSRAVGVEAEVGGETVVFEGGEVILSAGGVGSPQLLLLSGVGPADQMRNLGIPVVADLHGVGQNLRDHPLVNLSWRVAEDFALDPTAPPFQVILRCTAECSSWRDDLHLNPYVAAADRVYVLIVGLYLAASSGALALASRDPRVQPALDYNYLAEEFDRRRMREGVRLAAGLMRHEAFAGILAEPLHGFDEAALASDAALDDWLLRSARTFQHICGTCRMGPSTDPLAVVDQAGRVRGLEGLRVVDASIMPDCVRANINATVIMIGERIADMIRRPRPVGAD